MENRGPSEHFDANLASSLRKVFQTMLERDSERLRENEIITEKNIFQPAVKHNREVIIPFVEGCLLEGSHIENIGHWDQFFKNFKNGASSLILAEHKSNLDVVIFYYLMMQEKRLEEFDQLVFMAGRKLNEESVTVRLFAEMFNRLVVVPKSETQGITEEEMKQVYGINYAAQQFLKQNLEDYMYLIYPTGTRSRIWEPNSYEGITETVNYIEKFDQIIFMSSDGNCMFPLPGVPMNSEPLIRDQIIIRFSSPVIVKDFLKEQTDEFRKNSPDGTRQELKSFITKAVTRSIYSQKSLPPDKEFWTETVRDFLELQKKN